MDAFICTACGTQYTPSSVAPRECLICEEERQYVPPRGQTWTTLAALAAGHFNSYRQYEPRVIGIGTQPPFAIGQRALVVCTPNRNVLWDCIAMLDPATITLINSLGSLKAIGISHPHFHTTMEWRGSEAPARRDANPLRGAFSGRHRAALGQGRRRPRDIVLVGHRDGDDRPKIPQLHAQLSEFDPALRETGYWNCRCAGAFSVRYGLWPLFRSCHSDRRETDFGNFRQALCRCDKRRIQP